MRRGSTSLTPEKAMREALKIRARGRAQSRAYGRLSKAHPEEYNRYYKEETEKAMLEVQAETGFDFDAMED